MSSPKARPTSLYADRLRTRWKLGHRGKKSHHRYFRYRWSAFLIIHALLVVIPLSGLLRFDFWRGRHMLFGQPAEFLQVLRDFVIPFGLINIAIVIVVRWSGRFLCGWVCPVNFMNRWGDWLRGFVGLARGQLDARGHLVAISSSMLFASAFLLWFVDVRVFVEGSWTARGWSAGAWLGLSLVSYLQIVYLGWRTCTSVCPSGVYFSVLGIKTHTGIERREDGADCEDCKLCVRTCPMQLDPRDLLGQSREAKGIYFETLDNSSLCIRCGDCVEACERYFEPRELTATLRMGFLNGTGSALPADAQSETES